MASGRRTATSGWRSTAWRRGDPATADPAAARAHLEASRHAFHALGYPALAAQTVMALGVMAHDQGDHRGAAQRYAEAEALARPTGDSHVLAHIVGNQAWLARSRGDCLLARRLFEEALALRRAHRDRRGISNDLSSLGSLALAEGDATTARARLTEAMTILRDAGHVWSMPWLLRELAQVAGSPGQLPTRGPAVGRGGGAVPGDHRTATASGPAPRPGTRRSGPFGPSARGWTRPLSATPGQRARR